MVLTVLYPHEVGGWTMRNFVEFGGKNKEFEVLIAGYPIWITWRMRQASTGGWQAPAQEVPGTRAVED